MMVGVIVAVVAILAVLSEVVPILFGLREVRALREVARTSRGTTTACTPEEKARIVHKAWASLWGSIGSPCMTCLFSFVMYAHWR